MLHQNWLIFNQIWGLTLWQLETRRGQTCYTREEKVPELSPLKKEREQTHSHKNLLTLLKKLISLLEESELADASRKCLRRHIRKKNCKFFLLELSSIKVMEL